MLRKAIAVPILGFVLVGTWGTSLRATGVVALETTWTELSEPRLPLLGSDSVTNIVFTPASPATLAINSPVHVTFNYTTTDTNGVGVSFIPNTQSSGTSPVYFPPSGSGSGSFTSTTAVTVTSIHAVMYDQFSKTILFQETIPVNYTFGSSPPPPTACQPSATTLCLDDSAGDRRFQVQVSYATTQGGGSSGSGHAIPLSSLGVTHGGLFWFTDATNPELLLKVLNACSFNPHHWVFASAGTNQGVTIVVRDTQTGVQQVYTNPDIHPMVPIQDEETFPCP